MVAWKSLLTGPGWSSAFRHCRRRFRPSGDRKQERHVTDHDLVAVAEITSAFNPLPSQERSIHAAEVLDRSAGRGDDDARVVPRNFIRSDADRDVAGPADDVLSRSKNEILKTVEDVIDSVPRGALRL